MSAPAASSDPPRQAVVACLDGIVAESLLEIGGDGHMAREAGRRGVARALHLAADRDLRRELESMAEGFDVVYCPEFLGVVGENATDLGWLIRLTKRRLVLGVPTLSWRDLWRGGLIAVSGLAFGAPVVLGEGGKRRLSHGALRKLFNQENAVFEPIRIAPGSKGKAIVIADKRRIGHMVVICAPTSGGKSTIARRILDDRQFRQSLGIEDATWELMKAEDFFTKPAGGLDHVIVMYNLLRRLNKDLAPGDDDPLPLIFSEAERLTIVTLITTPERLRAQFRHSEMPDPSRRYSAKIRRLEEAYQRDDFLSDWYRDWFTFQESLASDRSTKWLLVLGPEGERLSDSAHWREIVGQTLGAKP